MKSRSLAGPMLTVYVGAVVLFLLLPLIVLLPLSFTSARTYDFPPPGFSLQWYVKLWEAGVFIDAFWLSVRVAVVATIISLLLGTMAAFGLTRVARKWQNLGASLFTSPLIFPHVIYGMAMLFFLTSIGMTRSFWGFVAAHVIITLPFIVRTVAASIGGIEQQYEEAAMNLGAGPWQAFRHVSLPLMLPGLFAGAAFSFIVSFDDFSTSLFLVSANQVTLPVEIYNYVEQIVDPSVAAISSLLVLLSFVVILAIDLTYGLERFFRSK